MSTDEPIFESGPERPIRVDRVTFPVLDGLTFRHAEGGGYETEDVDAFIRELKGILTAADDERTSLRADIAQLRDRLSDQGPSEVTVDAVGLLSQAQVIADKCIADAEQYARDLMMTARSQYREVLERAEKSASEAAAQAEQVPVQPAQSEQAAPAAQSGAGQMAAPAQPIAEVEYVRTYARVAQAQLKAVLDALTEQVEMLGQVPATPGSGSPYPQRPPRAEHAGPFASTAPGGPFAGPNHEPGFAPSPSEPSQPAPSYAAAPPQPEPVSATEDAVPQRSYGDVVWEHKGAGWVEVR